jgi:hypothetical protein
LQKDNEMLVNGKRKILLIIITFMLATIMPASALQYSDPSTGLKLRLIPNSGGRIDHQVGDYKLRDVKGVVLGGVGGEEKFTLQDNGLIRTIRIFPDPGGTKIIWEYADATVTGAVIYRWNSTEFSKDHNDWGNPIADVNAPTKEFVDPSSAASSGHGIFYMVMPKINGTPVARSEMFTTATDGNYIGRNASNIPYTSWPVVRYDAQFEAKETKLFALQFVPTSPTGFMSSLSEISAQANFTSGAIWLNQGGLVKLDCVNGAWTGNADIDIGTSFWLKSDTATSYAFTGALVNAAYNKPMLVGADMYSYAFPVDINQASSFVAPEFSKNDSIWVNKGGLLKYDYTDRWTGDFTLGLSEGFWYKTDAADKLLRTIP